MHDAASSGDLVTLKRLILHGHDVNLKAGLSYNTPLICAAGKGHTDCVEYLLQNGAQLDLKDQSGESALHMAALGGHLEVMKRLVDGGADVNQWDRWERTPLMWAVDRGHTEFVEYLLQIGAQVDKKDHLGCTALHLAADRGHLEVMKRLVDGRADVNQRDRKLNRTPLMYAAELGHRDCVEYLIQNYAEMDVFTAAILGDLKELKRLIDAGQDVNQRDRKSDRTPRMYAAELGHTDCVQYLIQNGAHADEGHNAFVELLQKAAWTSNEAAGTSDEAAWTSDEAADEAAWTSDEAAGTSNKGKHCMKSLKSKISFLFSTRVHIHGGVICIAICLFVCDLTKILSLT